MSQARRLYEVREDGRSLSSKLRSYHRARKLCSYLCGRWGRDAYLARWSVNRKPTGTRRAA